MAERKLATASYLVLGLVEMLGPVTPYQLKNFAAQTVVHFWSLPHTQIYTQCDRLVKDGYIAEKREESGRRRRNLTITKRGQRALDAWRDTIVEQPAEMRDLATLKLFFGADSRALAERQLAVHEDQLAMYLALKQSGLASDGPLEALESGIAFERAVVRLWKGRLK